MEKGRAATKLCKHCKTEIPYGAKVCPHCRKKQGGALKWVIIAVVVIAIVGAAGNSGDKDSKPQQASNTNTSGNSGKADNAKESESETVIEYLSVTADKLSEDLSSNAMKAQNDYEKQYLEITGKLGTIDSNGKYIGIDSNKDFDLTNIQCYIKSDEQKKVIMGMTRGDAITVKGYCKDIGELLGYQIDIDEVIAQ